MILLLACNGPDTVPPVEEEQFVFAPQPEEEARLIDTTPGPENAYLLPGRVDTAIPEDTGWQLGDEWIEASDRHFLLPTDEGVWIAAYDHSTYESWYSLVRGEVTTKWFDARDIQVRSVVLQDEGHFSGLVPWGDEGVLTASRDLRSVHAYDLRDPTGEPVVEFDPSAAEAIGSVATGDLDGDGLPEIAASEYYEFRPDVWVLNGQVTGPATRDDGLVLDNNDNDADFGRGVLIPGDLDGDGFDELIVYGFREARIFNGPVTGAPGIDDYDANVTDYDMLDRLVPVGDVDGDGVTDVMRRYGGVYMLDLPVAGVVSASDLHHTAYLCDGYVDRWVAKAVGVTGFRSEREIVGHWISEGDALLRQLWVTDLVKDGGVHSCLDEGDLVRNSFGAVVNAGVGDLSGSGANELLLSISRYEPSPSGRSVRSVLALTPEHVGGM